ncbi:MAG TPA: response regulator, partial [Chitinophagaceae bacterium]|nr:response regulator [Chitinophagaceae bacterium]
HETSHSISKKPKVLVADDNSDMREYIHRLLKDEFDVVMARDGEEARKKAIATLPELILSDIMMPRLDGFGLLKALRTNFSTRNIPLIFLSARAGEEAKVEGIESGADDYLVKPFSSKELLARVANQISISKARRESEKQFFNLFLQSPVHIHVLRGPEHLFEFFHPLAKAFTGGQDFTGKKIREVLPEIEGQGYFELLDQVYHDGKSFNIPESKALLRNNEGELTEYYFHITYLPWKDIDGKILGVLQFSFDVSEQVKARLILEEAEYKLQNAIDLADLGTWHIDLLTNFVLYDQRIVDWWGLDAEGAPLDTVINCILPEDREKLSAALQQALTETGIYKAEYRVANLITGEIRYIISKGKVFYENEKPVRLSGIARDITLQKMAQEQLEMLVTLRTQELQEANVELKRSNEDLKQFAYVASHDLQEPLRKIQTFSELANSNLNDTKAARVYLDKIDSSAARMTSLIKDVLAYSEVSRKLVENDQVDLGEIIENVKNDFELLIQQKNVNIIMGKMPVVNGSKRQFYQLFSNLISNSIKFSSDDPVIEISARVVERGPENIPLSPAPAYHELVIKDNGIGFDPIYAKQIFQLFSRLHNRTEYGGTGIGLSLCKNIVENHHGAITATSENGHGATFTIYLPTGLKNG